ncbi:hypothetical protein LJC10_06150, partial [Selenomonadales bacterium OttesenSCG-928-I06]|nr:hypothetical protein [Selenomonadales bacterium OttesenSCG-928-I06]
RASHDFFGLVTGVFSLVFVECGWVAGLSGLYFLFVLRCLVKYSKVLYNREVQKTYTSQLNLQGD